MALLSNFKSSSASNSTDIPPVGQTPVATQQTAPSVKFHHEAELTQSANGSGRWMYVVRSFSPTDGTLVGGMSAREAGFDSLSRMNNGNGSLPPNAQTMTLLDISLIGRAKAELNEIGFSDRAIMDVRDGSYVCHADDQTTRD